MKRMKKAWDILSNVITYLILAVIIAVAICFAMGIKPYITMSGSMEPNIHTGSVCFVNTKADYDEIKEGDVIAFETSTGSLVTHRAIYVSSEGIETKGDNNDVSDGISTTAENFRGETLFSIPYAGYVFVYLQKPQGIAIICVLIGAIVLTSILDSIEEKKEKKRISEASKQDESI